LTFGILNPQSGLRQGIMDFALKPTELTLVTALFPSVKRQQQSLEAATDPPRLDCKIQQRLGQLVYIGQL